VGDVLGLFCPCFVLACGCIVMVALRRAGGCLGVDCGVGLWLGFVCWFVGKFVCGEFVCGEYSCCACWFCCCVVLLRLGCLDKLQVGLGRMLVFWGLCRNCLWLAYCHGFCLAGGLFVYYLTKMSFRFLVCPFCIFVNNDGRFLVWINGVWALVGCLKAHVAWGHWVVIMYLQLFIWNLESGVLGGPGTRWRENELSCNLCPRVKGLR